MGAGGGGGGGGGACLVVVRGGGGGGGGAASVVSTGAGAACVVGAAVGGASVVGAAVGVGDNSAAVVSIVGRMGATECVLFVDAGFGGPAIAPTVHKPPQHRKRNAPMLPSISSSFLFDFFGSFARGGGGGAI